MYLWRNSFFNRWSVAHLFIAKWNRFPLHSFQQSDWIIHIDSGRHGAQNAHRLCSISATRQPVWSLQSRFSKVGRICWFKKVITSQIPPSPAKGDYSPFHFYVAAPVLSNKWVFIGERAKFIPAAPQRFKRMELTNDSLEVIVLGSHKEIVKVEVLSPSRELLAANCLFPHQTTELKVTCSDSGCVCKWLQELYTSIWLPNGQINFVEIWSDHTT